MNNLLRKDTSFSLTKTEKKIFKTYAISKFVTFFVFRELLFFFYF